MKNDHNKKKIKNLAEQVWRALKDI
jgi:hypothetical protein